MKEKISKEDLKNVMRKELKLDKKFQKPIKDKKIKLNLIDVKWTPEMTVEENKIDSQHKKLISYLNKLLKGIESGKELSVTRETLDFFTKYSKEHFVYEEKYMEKIGYPDLAVHREIHNGFLKFTEQFKKKFNENLYSKQDPKEFVSEKLRKLHEDCKKYLFDWLKNHIMLVDQKYHKFANSNLGKKKISPQKFSVSQITKDVKQEMISKQRRPIKYLKDVSLKDKRGSSDKYTFTGIEGFDELLEKGIPRGNSIIVAGGAGSGKTIFCLQTLVNNAKKGKKGLYMTFEEREDRLIEHMEDFGWPASDLIKKKKLKIMRMNPFDITRNVDALLAKQKGELLIDVDPVILPPGFKPDFIVIDSLTAIASTFTNREDSYRIYIEQLFRFLENIGATSFLITETEQIPKIFSQTGVEEFLADGVVVIYSLRHGNVRENAVEILKLRGAAHEKKIVAMQITSNGIVVYPEQEVFSEVGE